MSNKSLKKKKKIDAQTSKFYLLQTINKNYLVTNIQNGKKKKKNLTRIHNNALNKTLKKKRKKINAQMFIYFNQ